MENKNVGLKVGGGGTNIPLPPIPKKWGGTCPPCPPPPTSYASVYIDTHMKTFLDSMVIKVNQHLIFTNVTNIKIFQLQHGNLFNKN